MINLKRNWKKSLLAAITGAFMITGIAAYAVPDTVGAEPYKMASSQDQQQQPREGRQFDSEQEAQRIADFYGVDKAEVKAALDEGWKMPDVDAAALIAYASNSSLNDILKEKSMTNEWKDIAEHHGVTREKHHDAMQTLHINHLAEASGCSSSDIKKLCDDGYHMRDISMAAVLSKASGKSLNSVIGMKKTNNEWKDVAESLGVDKDTLFETMRSMHTGPDMGGFGGPRDGHRGDHRNDHRGGSYGENDSACRK
jgi:hypothetical protein